MSKLAGLVVVFFAAITQISAGDDTCAHAPLLEQIRTAERIFTARITGGKLSEHNPGRIRFTCEPETIIRGEPVVLLETHLPEEGGISVFVGAYQVLILQAGQTLVDSCNGSRRAGFGDHLVEAIILIELSKIDSNAAIDGLSTYWGGNTDAEWIERFFAKVESLDDQTVIERGDGWVRYRDVVFEFRDGKLTGMRKE